MTSVSPTSSAARSHAQEEFGALRPPDARLAEHRDGVGDGLDPGQRGASRRERLEQQEQSQCLGGVEGLGRADGRGGCRTRQAHDDAEHAHDEERHGQHQHARAVRDAPQVHGGEQSRPDQTHGQGMVCEDRESRREAGGAGGEADRDGQDVVDHEAGRGEQTDPGSQILLRHGVRSAAVRMHGDHLAVRDDQDARQPDDDQGDRQRRGDRSRPGDRQGDHDGLGTVRDRTQRVQRQRGEPLDGGQT
ncbi:hypothetical protein AQJ66_00750 [Streptomyces bungoensis]|uniref:Uncharacterized protein n=1 Tax=Streptomyces bungoensis TaxID=285568 RepID=A0A101TDA2_9ACTN|nr:hypothetical protein AQJ66_00750 [Streptomyces bungoensis]